MLECSTRERFEWREDVRMLLMPRQSGVKSYTSFFKFAYGILLGCRMQQQLTIARFHLTPRMWLRVMTSLTISLRNGSIRSLPKTLHLDFLFISKSQYLAEVLRGCPNLEDFRAYHIFLDNKLEGIEFQTMPKLVKADLKLDYVFEFPLKVVSNVEHLRFFLKV
ncbi:hypothetical protein ACSQ67_025372 [Phaseolus vulgaris]